jgi:tRNA (cytidine56-2'-O)-methyltransferase
LLAIPTEEECLRILIEEGADSNVVEHCCVVKEVAKRIAECCGAYIKLVIAGALLHDIGRTRTHGVDHVIEGMKIAMERNLPIEIVRIIQRHLGAGLTEKEAELLGFPPGIYMPETLEEKIVTHADNLVDEKGVRTVWDASVDFERRGFLDAAKRMRLMHEELSRMCGKDIDELLFPLRRRMKLSGSCSEYTSPQGTNP